MHRLTQSTVSEQTKTTTSTASSPKKTTMSTGSYSYLSWNPSEFCTFLSAAWASQGHSSSGAHRREGGKNVLLMVPHTFASGKQRLRSQAPKVPTPVWGHFPFLEGAPSTLSFTGTPAHLLNPLGKPRLPTFLSFTFSVASAAGSSSPASQRRVTLRQVHRTQRVDGVILFRYDNVHCITILEDLCIFTSVALLRCQYDTVH